MRGTLLRSDFDAAKVRAAGVGRRGDAGQTRGAAFLRWRRFMMGRAGRRRLRSAA